MGVTKSRSASVSEAAAPLRRLFAYLDGSATRPFIALCVGCAWLFWFLLAHADYAHFMQVCNHDPAAALRTDEIIALGQRPGVDFFYYYGALPLLVTRAFFSVFARSPLGLLGLLAVFGVGFSAGLATIVEAFKPTRLGVLLVAVASVHTITILVPTHALEAALLIWTVALRIREQRAAAIALSCCGIFTKISMGSVLLAGLIALTIFDAIRERSSRPLISLLAAPAALIALFVGCSLVLGQASVAACFDPRLGAALYRETNLGFLREGRQFWHPAGHTFAWYLGGVPGPWIAASIVLLALVPGAAFRLLRRVKSGASRDFAAICDETCVIACLANLAFVVVFFGPSMSVSYYAWVPLVGVTPLLAKARTGFLGSAGAPQYGWLALTICLLLSSKATVAQAIGIVRQPGERIGQTWMPIDEARELRESLNVAHGTGAGVVTVLARAANFGLVDPTLRQGRYWMMQAGMRATPSIAELSSLAKSSDALFVTKFDYPGLLRIPEFKPLIAEAERLYEGNYFIVLRAPARSIFPH